MQTADFSWWISFHSRRLSIFGRSCGLARLSDHAHSLHDTGCACARFSPYRGDLDRVRPANHRLLRVRTKVPAPFSEREFTEFNKHYVTTLSRWKLFDGTINPVARINVCPEIDPPGEPSFHAFSFAVPASEAAASFVISGSEDIIRRGETSADAMREKAISALGQMEKRMQALGVSWADTTATQVYTVHDLYPFLADEIVRRGAARSGLTWHFNRPPVTGLEFEVDCRGVMYEQVVP